MRLLIAEDDALLGAGLRAALSKWGFVVTWVRHGRAVLDVLRTEPFLALVLDLGLPDISGVDVLRKLRAQGHKLPVLVLTARDSTQDKVSCLDLGADDYLVKTTDMEELVARLRALIRRSGGAGGSLSIGDLTLNMESRTLTLSGQLVSLSKREFELLRMLMEGAGRVFTRTQIEQSLYGWDRTVDSNTVEVHIHNLRQKIGARKLQTVRGVGYTIARAPA